MRRTGRILLKISVLLVTLTAVMAAGYFIALRYYEGREGLGGSETSVAAGTKTGEPTERAEMIGTDVLLHEFPAEGTTNLIYCQEEDGDLSALVLEVWSRSRQRLSYITIPVDTGFTISAELYRSLAVEEPEVPQMMRMAKLYRYYEKEGAFRLGVPVAEELLDVKIDSFTVMDADGFGEQFRLTKKGIWRYTKKAAKKLFAREPEVETAFYLLPGKQLNAGYEADRVRMRGELAGVLEFVKGGESQNESR